jgi:hypothetical protein
MVIDISEVIDDFPEFRVAVVVASGRAIKERRLDDLATLIHEPRPIAGHCGRGAARRRAGQRAQ